MLINHNLFHFNQIKDNKYYNKIQHYYIVIEIVVKNIKILLFLTCFLCFRFYIFALKIKGIILLFRSYNSAG